MWAKYRNSYENRPQSKSTAREIQSLFLATYCMYGTCLTTGRRRRSRSSGRGLSVRTMYQHTVYRSTTRTRMYTDRRVEAIASGKVPTKRSNAEQNSSKISVKRSIAQQNIVGSAAKFCRKISKSLEQNWSGTTGHPPLRLKRQHDCHLHLVAAEKRFSDVVWAHPVRGGGGDQRLTIYTHVKHAQKFKLSLFIFLQSSVFLLTKCWGQLLAITFLCQALILLLQPVLAGANFPSIFFSVDGAPILGTCQANLIEEGFEGFSALRYSYFAESSGSCQDQVDATHYHGEKTKI